MLPIMRRAVLFMRFVVGKVGFAAAISGDVVKAAERVVNDACD